MCQRPIWCRVRRTALVRLLVVASGSRSWSCKKATRRVRKLLAIASSRREVTHRRRRLIVAQCFRLLIAASEGSSPVERLSAQQRTLVVASSEGDSPLPQQRAPRRRGSRGLLVGAAESSSSPLQRARSRRGASGKGIAIGELVDAAENYSLSPSPQLRATASESASPLDSSLTQQRVPRCRVRGLVDVGELVAGAGDSSLQQRAHRRSKLVAAAENSSLDQRARQRNKELVAGSESSSLVQKDRGCSRELVAGSDSSSLRNRARRCCREIVARSENPDNSSLHPRSPHLRARGLIGVESSVSFLTQ